MSTTTQRPKRRVQRGRFETITFNFGGKVRRAVYNGREHYVVPVSMIVPGVLNGSKGPLLYPSDEIARDPGSWNGIPLVVYHPKDHTGTPISARSPDVLEKSGVGSVFNTRTNNQGKLRGEAWFDIERTRTVDKRVLDMIEAGKVIELSTGLFTDNEPSDGVFNGKAYKYIARNYRPDHLAILPDEVGACSVKDGCGVNVNSSGENCGTGAGGFKPGNDCAKGGGKRKKKASDKLRDMETPEVLGYELDRESLMPKRKALDLSSPGDYGADPVGDGTFRMVPSGDIVDFDERNRRLEKRTNNQNCGIGSEGFEQGNDCAKGKIKERMRARAEGKSGSGFGTQPGDHLVPSSMTRADLESSLDTGDKVKVHSSIGMPGLWKVKEVHKQNATVSKGQTNKIISKGDITHIKRNGVRIVITENVKRGDQTTNSIGDFDMKKLSDKERKQIVDNLIGNCDCGQKANNNGPWNEDDREALMNVKDEKLQAFDAQRKAATANAMPPFIKKKKDKMEDDCEDGDKKKMTGNSKQLTMDEFMAVAPPELKGLLTNAGRIVTKQKEDLVAKITANSRNRFTAEYLMGKDTDELEALAALAADPVATPPVSRFLGQAPIGNTTSAADVQKFRDEDSDFMAPTMNYEEHVKKNRSA